MKVLLDTSVLVAALLESHKFHQSAFKWLKQIKEKKVEGIISAHSLAELYAILTRLPVKPKVSPGEAKDLIQNNIIGLFKVIPLSEEDYNSVIEHLSKIKIIGGAVYDALIMQVASKVDIDFIITLNEKDFRRVFPQLSEKVILP